MRHPGGFSVRHPHFSLALFKDATLETLGFELTNNLTSKQDVAQTPKSGEEEEEQLPLPQLTVFFHYFSISAIYRNLMVRLHPEL